MADQTQQKKRSHKASFFKWSASDDDVRTFIKELSQINIEDLQTFYNHLSCESI